jgi:hypothetical protein
LHADIADRHSWRARLPSACGFVVAWLAGFAVADLVLALAAIVAGFGAWKQSGEVLSRQGLLAIVVIPVGVAWLART